MALPTAKDTAIGEESTAAANKHVAEVLCRDMGCRKRKATIYYAELRAKIGKYAAVNGTALAQKHFKKELGDLLESTVSPLAANAALPNYPSTAEAVNAVT